MHSAPDAMEVVTCAIVLFGLVAPIEDTQSDALMQREGQQTKQEVTGPSG